MHSLQLTILIVTLSITRRALFVYISLWLTFISLPSTLAAWNCYCTHAQNGGATEDCCFEQQRNYPLDAIKFKAGGWGLVCILSPYKNATDRSYIHSVLLTMISLMQQNLILAASLRKICRIKELVAICSFSARAHIYSFLCLIKGVMKGLGDEKGQANVNFGFGGGQ